MRRLYPLTTIAGMFVLVLLVGCSGIRVSTDYDPTINFLGLRSYAWLPDATEETGDYRLDNAIVAKRVRGAAERQLKIAGFEKVDLESASFLVAYHVALTEKLDISTFDNYYGYYGYGPYWGGYPGYGVGYGPGYGYGLGGYYAPDVYSRYYEEGTVVLDILDPKTRDLIWRGSAKSEVNPKSTPQERDAAMNEAFRRILERFPPGKIKAK